LLKESKYSKHTAITVGILSVFWPVMALVYGWLNKKSIRFKNVIWAFCTFFGLAFIISSDVIDASRYAEWLKGYYESPLSYFDQLNKIFNGELGRGDYYEVLVGVTIAQFTANYKVLFAFYGLIFGYFYSRNISLVLDKINHNVTIWTIPLIVLLVFINPIWNINGARFYTAAQVFVYGFLQYYINGKRSGLMVILMSPIFHFSFVFITAVSLLAILIGRIGLNLLYILIPLSLLATLFDPMQYLYHLDNLGDLADDKLYRYTNPEYIKRIISEKENVIWFIKYSDLFIKILCFLIGFSFILFKKQIRKMRYERFVVASIILLISSSMVQSIPSMGRFFIPVAMILVSIFLILFSSSNKIVTKRLLSIIMTPMILLVSVVTLRMGMAYFGPTLFFSNFLIEPFLYDMPTFYK
jgi:hypothetical protein